MGKHELRQELEKQIKEKKLSKWVGIGFMSLGIVLTISIIFAIIGIPMFIIAIVFAYRAESKIKNLRIKSLEL